VPDDQITPHGWPVPRERQSESPLVQRLADELAAAAGTRPATALEATDLMSDGVRDAVARYVAEQRNAGVPPEQVLVAVKAALRGALRAPARPTATGVDEELTDEVVRFSIVRYFRAD
jgi:hypothetical protein